MIFLTSNPVTEVLTEMCSGEEPPPPEALLAAIRPILSNHFKPGLARMTIAPFLLQAPDIMPRIVALRLDKLALCLHFK